MNSIYALVLSVCLLADPGMAQTSQPRSLAADTDAVREIVGRMDDDPQRAWRDLDRLAAQGNAYAQFTLGVSYLGAYRRVGYGFPENVSRGLALIRQAAAQNEPHAVEALPGVEAAIRRNAAATSHPTASRDQPGAGATSAPQMRPATPSVAQRAPLNGAAGQSGTRTFLDPQTGRHCVTMQGWEMSGDNVKHLNFRNTCNLTFAVTLRSPGLPPKGNGIGPNSTMHFTFVRSDARAWAAEWSYEIYGGQ